MLSNNHCGSRTLGAKRQRVPTGRGYRRDESSQTAVERFRLATIFVIDMAFVPALLPSNALLPGCSTFAGTRLTRSAAVVVRGVSLSGRHRATQVSMQLGSPSIKVGRPKTSIKKDVGTINQTRSEPETDTGKGAAKARPKRKTQSDDLPMYKVILLGDEAYAEAHVVTQLQKIIQIDKKEAARVFAEAQSTGSAVACVVCEEHAEFYAQQLLRQDIFVTVEKDE